MELSQQALNAKHNFELAGARGDVETQMTILGYLHDVGLSGLADSLYERV